MLNPKESVLNSSEHLEASLLVHWVFCWVSGVLWAQWHIVIKRLPAQLCTNHITAPGKACCLVM